MTQLVYRIKDLEAHPEGVAVEGPLAREFMEQALAGLGVSEGHARLDGRLLYQGGNVLLHGTLTGSLTTECQRCLAPARVPIDQRLNVVYVPRGGVEVEELEFDPEDPDDVDYAHHDRESVDLGPLLREQIVLAMPIAVVCREECRGLCPVCGVDRNIETCSCEPNVSMSPFAALKNLKL
jgi:uncharacterized protein